MVPPIVLSHEVSSQLHCGELEERQVREGSFIESIRIVCSNLFRKLPSVSRTAGRTGGEGTGGDVNINTH